MFTFLLSSDIPDSDVLRQGHQMEQLEHVLSSRWGITEIATNHLTLSRCKELF